MDAIDKQILQILSTDARISMRDLGKRVAMSNTAVAERVKKLEEAGVIAGYAAVIDRTKLGCTVQVFVSMELTYESREHPAPFLRYLRNSPFIVQAWPIYTSGMDYMLHICCETTTQLEQISRDMVEFGLTYTHLAGNEVLGLLGEDDGGDP